MMKGTIMKHPAILIGLAALCLTLPGAAAPDTADTLVVNGKSAPADVRTIGGSAYVKLADIAKALGMIVTKRSDGKYELTRAGGANQLEGVTRGKVGDVLFDGRWRFQVQSVATPTSYTMKTAGELYDNHDLSTFDRPNRLVKSTRGNSLVVLQCRATNGVNANRTLWTAISDDRIHTALTDTDGSSYPPIAYDFDGGPTQSKSLVPGAALNFAVLFSVPEGTHIKDLIFSLKNNQGDEKANDVRVTLVEAKAP
jgi:hypothetical protein